MKDIVVNVKNGAFNSSDKEDRHVMDRGKLEAKRETRNVLKRFQREVTLSRPVMGRKDHDDDLRTKLDSRRKETRGSHYYESRESNHRERDRFTDKENSRRKRSRSRSHSYKKRQRSRSRSRSRQGRRREATRSRSRDRKPLSEHKLKKSTSSPHTKSRKRNQSEDLGSDKNPKQIKAEAEADATTEKVEKKKKKKNKDDDDKTKKKKKKKDKDKKDKSKKKKKSTEDPSAENSKNEDPKSRKERIDSGISTCSLINGESSQAAPATVEKQDRRRVSDSPLSGSSISPSPPPNNSLDLSSSLPSVDTSTKLENDSSLTDPNLKDSIAANLESSKDQENFVDNHKENEKEILGNTDIDIRERDRNGEARDIDIRKSGDRDARDIDIRKGRDHDTRENRDIDVRNSRESRDRGVRDSRDSRDRDIRDSRESRDRDLRKSRESRDRDIRDSRESRDRDVRKSARESRDRDNHKSRDRDHRSWDRDGRRSKQVSGDKKVDDHHDRNEDDHNETRKSVDKENKKSRETSRNNDEREHRHHDYKTRSPNDKSVERRSRDRDGGRGSKDREDMRDVRRDRDRRDRDDKDYRNRTWRRNHRDRRDLKEDIKMRPHMRRERREVTPRRDRVLTPTISPSRAVDNSSDKDNVDKDKKVDSETQPPAPLSPTTSRQRSVSREDRFRSSRDRDYHRSQRYDRRTPPRRRNYNHDYHPRFNRRFSHDDNHAAYSKKFNHSESWESQVDNFMSRIGATNLKELPRDDLLPNGIDVSLPPPPIGMVPEHQSEYVDTAFPRLDLPTPTPALPAPVSAGHYVPPVSYRESVEDMIEGRLGHDVSHGSNAANTLSSQPSSPSQPGYSSPYYNQDGGERSSLEKETKPLTVKEKKIQDTLQKEIWQTVAHNILQDPFFIKRRNKKGDEDQDEVKEKGDKCVARLAQKLEKAGFKEARLCSILKDNEKGVEGFINAMKCHVANNDIPVDRESKKPKDKLEVELLDSGNFFRYAGEFIHKSLTGKSRHASSSSLDAVPTSVLQNILQTAAALPKCDSNSSAGDPASGKTSPTFDPIRQSFVQFEKFVSVKLVESVKADLDTARDTAGLYIQTIMLANFDFTSLENTVRNYVPPAPEFEGEPEQTIYGYLLEIIREIPFDKYPRKLSNSDLDSHTANIVRITLEYFTRERSPTTEMSTPSVRTVGEEEEGFVGPMQPTEVIPAGGNTDNQLPQRRYVMVYVSVDTVSVDGNQVPWQVSVHIPGLPEDEDPDYECLMVPEALCEKPGLLADLGFTYDEERGLYHHHGTEFGRRKAEMEDVSLDKFANFLDELRSGLKGAGTNNGLVLVFETGEDLAVIQHLFNKHKISVFYDAVRGLCCLDNYQRVTRSEVSSSYTWPSYTYKVGDDGGRWISTVSRDGVHTKVEAVTKPECIYTITCQLLSVTPTYNNFTKWYCYPVQHSQVATMTAVREHIIELLPLQFYVDRQLFTKHVEIALEGVYAARNQVDTNRVYSSCARQVIRRLVALDFTQDVLMKNFQDPAYEIPSSVFLQDLTEVQKLRVHEQTDLIRGLIKQFFTQKINPAAATNSWNH